MFKEGKWIWLNENENENDSYVEFYDSFPFVKSAKCKISCDSDYTLFINGKYVSSNQYGDFEHYKSVDEIDITPFLQKDINHFALLVWYFGAPSQRYKPYKAGAIFEIASDDTIILSSGTHTMARKSKAYKSGKCKILTTQLGFSYSYDATREDNWKFGRGTGFTKSSLVSKNCKFVPRPIKKLELGSKALAKRIDNTNIYDLGKEYTGLFYIRLRANSPCDIEIAYGECLDDFHVKKILGNRDFSIDLKVKAKENEHTSYMLRFACRYIEIFTQGEIFIDEIGIIPQYYPVKAKENPLKSKIDRDIYDICVNTLQLCMMEHYVDCPWREQCLYAFDSRNQMLCGYYAFENKNALYARQNLILMAQDRRDDGLMSICYPCGVNLTIPSFSLYYVVSVKEYIENTNDVSIISIVDSKINEILNTFLKNRKNNLVYRFTGHSHWNFYDWSDHLDGWYSEEEKSISDAMINLLTILALTSYKEICKLCSLSFPFEKDLKDLKIRTREEYLDKNKCEFKFTSSISSLSLVNALGILCGITSKKEAEAICKRLSALDFSPCSLSMKCFIYDALIKTDKELYKDFILNDIRLTYSKMIETGTVWETALGHKDFDNAGSLCHGWSSIPIYYYEILK